MPAKDEELSSALLKDLVHECYLGFL